MHSNHDLEVDFSIISEKKKKGDEEALEEAQGKEGGEETQTRGRKSNTMLIFLTVGKKLMANPNTHATLLGLIWASIQFRLAFKSLNIYDYFHLVHKFSEICCRWNIKFPAIVEKSIAILSSGGLGMAMFSLGMNHSVSTPSANIIRNCYKHDTERNLFFLIGLFMASRPSIIACGIRMAAVAMIMKFIGGPALMAAASTTVGLEGKLLRVAIVQVSIRNVRNHYRFFRDRKLNPVNNPQYLQAALPQGVVPFVFAKEYNVHPDILSTG